MGLGLGNGRGGPRPGSGRPTKASLAEKAQRQVKQSAQFNEACLRDLALFYETAKQLALGLWVEEVDEATGSRRVYQKAPDKQVLLNLMDHAKGKPTTSQMNSPDTEIKLICSIPRPPKVKLQSASSIKEEERVE